MFLRLRLTVNYYIRQLVQFIHRNLSSQVSPPIIGVNEMPTEIWDNILHRVSAKSMPHVALTSRAFYKYGNPYLYKYVHFVSRNLYNRHSSVRHRPRKIGAHREQNWLYDPNYSSQIFRPGAFLQTIVNNSGLKAYVFGASIEWAKEDADTYEVKHARQIVQLINPSITLLHLRPSHFNVPFLQGTYVTSLDLPYVEVSHDSNLVPELRENVYAVFEIPTLRHLSLQHVRSWNSFTLLPAAEVARYAHTSEVVSLSLPNTVALFDDLKEILSWPKSLKSFHHEVYEEDGFRPNPPSPSALIEALYPQRHSLEEFLYDNGCGYEEEPLEHSFGRALRDFVQLKRMNVTIECLFRQNENSQDYPPVEESFPPNIEEMIIELPRDFYWSHWGHEDGTQYELDLKRWLQSVAHKKQTYFPYLRRMVLWQSDTWLKSQYCLDAENYPEIDAGLIMRGLEISSIFEKEGIKFEYILNSFLDNSPSFMADEIFDTGAEFSRFPGEDPPQ